MRIKLITGDCLEKLKLIPDNFVDSVVTDPPAGISFLGKSWDDDKGGRKHWIKWMEEVFVEVKRTLKPGGHCFVWALPRTSHWTATALEDAGFEIRDIVTHVFGSGFPKSHNIEKTINKIWNKKLENVKNVEKNFFQQSITMDGQNIVQGNVLVKIKEKDMIEFVKIVENNSTFQELMLNEQINQVEHFVIINVRQNINNNLQVTLIQIGKVESLKDVMDMLQLELVTENTNLNMILLWKNILEGNLEAMKKYTTLTSLKTITGLKIWNLLQNPNIQENIAGLGTGLKPASEHWILCRKPLSEKTIADNVLKWGTGGINIDKSRIETSDIYSYPNGPKGNTFSIGKEPDGKRIQPVEINSNGRFPANFIHDGSDEVNEEFDKAGILKTGGQKETKIYGSNTIAVSGLSNNTFLNSLKGFLKAHEPNQGSAARFFYCSKASGKEKNEGLEDMEDKKSSGQQITEQGGTAAIGNHNKTCSICKGSQFDRGNGICECEEPDWKEVKNNPTKNNHPTIKPIKLMSYLINMITPPDGIVLDPFLGSGSTGVAAVKSGFSFIGIEKEEEYMIIAKKRIDYIKNNLKMD